MVKVYFLGNCENPAVKRAESRKMYADAVQAIRCLNHWLGEPKGFTPCGEYQSDPSDMPKGTLISNADRSMDGKSWGRFIIEPA